MREKAKRFGSISQISKFLLAGAAIFMANMSLPAAGFKGAAEVWRESTQASVKPKEKTKDPFEPFREKLKAFESQATNLEITLAVKA